MKLNRDSDRAGIYTWIKMRSRPHVNQAWILRGHSFSSPLNPRENRDPRESRRIAEKKRTKRERGGGELPRDLFVDPYAMACRLNRCFIDALDHRLIEKCRLRALEIAVDTNRSSIKYRDVPMHQKLPTKISGHLLTKRSENRRIDRALNSKRSRLALPEAQTRWSRGHMRGSIGDQLALLPSFTRPSHRTFELLSRHFLLCVSSFTSPGPAGNPEISHRFVYPRRRFIVSDALSPPRKRNS